ncbi:transposase [Cryobacterium sp. TMS1-20-1]|uniref:transposase n=1 Tax=Cryobacterium sp. TMS1-20-1 TaxID=1259223 RepID=UPI001F540908|nr:transposase [Cryobacterium sp. TMS1-20-1]
MLAWFSSDSDCRDYLEWLPWPDGFVCAECGQAGGLATAGSCVLVARTVPR